MASASGGNSSSLAVTIRALAPVPVNVCRYRTTLGALRLPETPARVALADRGDSAMRILGNITQLVGNIA
jgi:hypothetical protein